MLSCFNDSLFTSILFVVLMERWHGFIVSSNTKIYISWFDLCCSISNIQNSMPQNLTLIGHHLPGEGNGNALQYSCLENPIDRGAWRAIVHRVAKSQTQLSDYILQLLFFLRFFFFFYWWGLFLKSLLNLLQYCFCIMFWFFGQEACGILSSWPGIQPAPPDLEEVLTTGPSSTFFKRKSAKILWKDTGNFIKLKFYT